MKGENIVVDVIKGKTVYSPENFAPVKVFELGVNFNSLQNKIIEIGKEGALDLMMVEFKCKFKKFLEEGNE